MTCPNCHKPADRWLAPFCIACADALGVSAALARLIRRAIDDACLEPVQQRDRMTEIVRALAAVQPVNAYGMCIFCGRDVATATDHDGDCAWRRAVDSLISRS